MASPTHPRAASRNPSPSLPGDVTRHLQRWAGGDERALEELISLVYEELRRRAARRLACRPAAGTLQPTSLVHEVFLRLVEQRRMSWRDRGHFFAIAALMMRRVLVDEIRRHSYAKRGGQAVFLPLDEALDTPSPGRTDASAAGVLEIDAALAALEKARPELARIVELRYFGGFTHREIASLLGVSVPTVVRRWRLARAWLYRHLHPGEEGS